MRKNKIVLTDTNALFTDALRLVLASEEDLDVSVRGDTSSKVLRSLLAMRPDVIVIHQPRPDPEIIQILREMRRRLKDIHILFIVQEPTGDLISLASASTSVGIMSEAGSVAELLGALRSVVRGERYISTDALASIAPADVEESREDPLREVTPREREVLYWLSHGLTNREISQRMILSEKTVKNHVSHLLRKLDLTDRTKAAALAWRDGLPRISEDFFSLPAVQPMLK